MSRPLILVTNDDGILAEGLRRLEQAAAELGDVVTCAPDRERSAIGHAISLHRPLRIRQIAEHRYAIDGTPTDCVYLAVNHLLGRKPDLVLSGINRGANVGDDVTYSGTVAGAFEGTILGVPSAAFSVAHPSTVGYDSAARLARVFGAHILRDGLPRGVLLNVNVPGGEVDPQEVRYTRLGKRHYGNVVVENKDPRGHSYFWIGGSRIEEEDIAHSDCNAIRERCASVTPIHLDMTDYRTLRKMATWQLDGVRSTAPPLDDVERAWKADEPTRRA